MEGSSSQGASISERLLAAARTDNEDLLLETIATDGCNINCADGLGQTPLHLAARYGSTDVLEHILSHEDCDVDPIDRIERATPLHFAVQFDQQEPRLAVVKSLLDAGADISIKDKNGETAIDLIPPGDQDLKATFQYFQKKASYSRGDIASDDEDDGEPGSGSEEE